MSETREKETDEERSCQTCAISHAGLEKMNETGNILSAACTPCIKCSRNIGRQIFGPMLEQFFGSPIDNWQPRVSLNTTPPKSKKIKKGK